ncbi:MAG: M15 family metallopeptidase [Acidimicrobiia bacterium]|nr:M15 family metallopeptidase [Acidimicrobiia bacterium]
MQELLAFSPSQEGRIAQFTSEIQPVDAATVPHSWRPGCPLPLEDLRLLSVTYWGFDGSPHQGELVVNAHHAEDIVSVMGRLYAAQFPIERMELVDVYEGDDDASMAANNTSAFNCREVSRRPGVWSQHSFGLAIDINPVQNPYILRDGTVLPPDAITDRTSPTMGLIARPSVAVDAFAEIGWTWGGDWSGVVDYQHFSAAD